MSEEYVGRDCPKCFAVGSLNVGFSKTPGKEHVGRCTCSECGWSLPAAKMEYVFKHVCPSCQATVETKPGSPESESEALRCGSCNTVSKYDEDEKCWVPV